MTGWDALNAELDRWTAAGREATFWWRDDDAVSSTDALKTLLELTGDAGISIALAVIPAGAGDDLADTLKRRDNIAILQHGYAHLNHEPKEGAKSEFGPARSSDACVSDLAAGRARLTALFDDAARAIFVPPWNRIDPAVISLLPSCGFHGLSTYKARPRAVAAPGTVQINTHADIIDWRGNRGFFGTDRVLEAVADHLQARRLSTGDAAEPTGLLTHHLVHDNACWDFLRHFAGAIGAHPGARWVRADEIFKP